VPGGNLIYPIYHSVATGNEGHPSVTGVDQSPEHVASEDLTWRGSRRLRTVPRWADRSTRHL